MDTAYAKNTQRPRGGAGREPRARIFAAFSERGTSLRAWAMERGYRPVSVYSAVATWAGRTDRQPHGGQARRIMDGLRDALGPGVVPPVQQIQEGRGAA